jgi:hypothetical protein
MRFGAGDAERLNKDSDMTRDDLKKVNELEKRMKDLEWQRDMLANADRLSLSCAYQLELKDYEEPSLIGATFREVRASLLRMIDGQISDVKREFAAVGVTC